MHSQAASATLSPLAHLSGDIPAGIAAIDRQGLFIDLNDQYRRLHGVDGHDLRGRHFTEVTPERLRAPMQRLHDALFVNGHEEPSCWQLPRRDGGDIFVRCHSVLTRCGQGRPCRVVTMVDMTEHRRSERAIELEKAEVQDVVSRLHHTQHRTFNARRLSALDELLRGVAHELNTPIGVCLTATTHLERRLADLMAALEAGDLGREGLDRFLGDARDTLALLRVSTERAGTVVDSFRQISIGAGQEDPVPVRLRPHVEAALHALAPRLGGGAEVSVKVPDDLTLVTCPGALSRVLTALLDNALTHGLRDSAGGRISVWAVRTSEMVTLTVRDNGAGIPAADLPRVFDPFFRGGEGGGLHKGLGLCMAYNLVTGVLRGAITAESVVGHHTAFRITLPLDGRPRLH